MNKSPKFCHVPAILNIIYDSTCCSVWHTKGEELSPGEKLRMNKKEVFVELSSDEDINNLDENEIYEFIFEKKSYETFGVNLQSVKKKQKENIFLW